MIKLFLILIGISIGFVLLLFGVLWGTRKFHKKKFEEDYIFISSCIKYWVVCPQTYNRLIEMLTKLSLNDANDPEKTKQLWETFNQRFADYDKEFKKKSVLADQN